MQTETLSRCWRLSISTLANIGIEFGRVRPSDCLNSIFTFRWFAGFDWSLTFCEGFFQQFNLDLSDRFDEAAFEAIGNFLVEQISKAKWHPSHRPLPTLPAS